MKKNNFRKECGSVEVEATIILPIAILSVILLLYLSLFMFQRANLQASLETVLVYYKNTATDTYVNQNNELEYVVTDSGSKASGNSYSVTGALNPYRGLGDMLGALTGWGNGKGLSNQESFEKYFKSVAGGMLFEDDLELTIDYKNQMIFRQLEVTAVQKVKAPIDFSILGIGNEYVISATARVNVIDHDNMIRNVDYAIDIVEDTKLGELARNFASKFGELYQKMKNVLGVK